VYARVANHKRLVQAASPVTRVARMHADSACVLAEMFQDIRNVTSLFNDVTPTVSKYWEGPGTRAPSPPRLSCAPL